MPDSINGVKFVLKAGNGEVILTSELHKSLATSKSGIESVKNNAPNAAIEDQTVEGFITEKNPKFEIFLNKNNEYCFRLKAKNGQVIAMGDGYKSKPSWQNGIAPIKKNAADATVVVEEKK
ncbi:hypothetical protein AKG39_16900 [Acetobacterium bakii]|uniref:DUF1508 domain-containing protein n=1 Tax=Acetobacterium bakii TaxID=52689 RepID=A0A0L6TWX5_9FIRM|nr:hypothetical protein AKG39_16900 [Acetobacterium bakii]